MTNKNRSEPPHFAPDTETPAHPSWHHGVPRLTMRLLHESLYRIGPRGAVVCRLWRMEPDPRHEGQTAVYAIGMEGLGIRRLCRVGTDAARARRMYETLVRNCVSPCTLCDIMNDLLDGVPDP